MTHTCYGCGEQKPATDFYAKAGRPGKLLLVCKDCLNVRRRRRRARHMRHHGRGETTAYSMRRPLHYAASFLISAERALARGNLKLASRYLACAERYLIQGLPHG